MKFRLPTDLNNFFRLCVTWFFVVFLYYEFHSDLREILGLGESGISSGVIVGLFYLSVALLYSIVIRFINFLIRLLL